jgi:hypothetical protein
MSTLCFENAILRECKGQLVAIVSDMVVDGQDSSQNIFSISFGIVEQND